MGVAPRVELMDFKDAGPYLKMGVKHFCIGWDVAHHPEILPGSRHGLSEGLRQLKFLTTEGTENTEIAGLKENPECDMGNLI